jgi:hypothetical protein
MQQAPGEPVNGQQEQVKQQSQYKLLADDRSAQTGDSSSIATTLSRSRSVLPKALPDTDDISMKHVTDYIRQYEQDLYFSFVSDSFFIVGGFLYVVLSVWDVRGRPQSTILVQVVDILAPTVYLFNSCIDVVWAYRTKRRMGTRKAMSDTWQDWRVLLDIDDTPAAEDAEATSTWYHRLRKHSAHRRTIIAAFTFGIAATFGLAAVLFGDSLSDRYANILVSFSVYFYFANAIFSCSGKRNRPWLQPYTLDSLQNPESLEDMGDLLFLVGSSVDAVVWVLRLVDENPGWGVLSSVLWCVDACLYFRSDIIMHERLRRSQLEGSALV